MKLLTIFILTVISVFLVTCNIENSPEMGEVQFSMSYVDINNARTEELEISKIILSVESVNGEQVFEEKEFMINKFGSGYLSEPILMKLGEYEITKFLVLNELNEIIYATPLQGSALSGLVNHPLPLSFTIIEDEITEVVLEVIETASYDPEDLGYTSLSFNIIPTQDILVSVLSNHGGTYSFINSELTVYNDGDSSFTASLGDSINVVRLRSDADIIQLKFTTERDSVKYVDLNSDTLTFLRKEPLLVTFDEVDLSTGLIAYYPFDGNADDQSGNNLHGSVEGASLTTDHYGNSSSAYEFTGNNDVIVVDHNDLLNITDSLTLSVWINLYSSNQYGSRIIDKGVRGVTTGFLLDIVNPSSSSSSYINTIRFIGREGWTNITEEEITLNSWNHITVTYLSGTVKIYLNSILISTTYEEESKLLTHAEDLQIGNDIYGSGQNLYDPFRGKIDEVRIYNRVLNPSEISTLFNL